MSWISRLSARYCASLFLPMALIPYDFSAYPDHRSHPAGDPARSAGF